MFFICALLSGIIEGGGGVHATKLDGDHTSAIATLTVDSTRGYLVADYVIVGDETIRYTGITPTSFTGCTRGYDDTDAKAYLDNTMVYSSDANVLNSALGFNIITTGTTMGKVDLMMFGWNFVTKSVPRLIMWDFSFLRYGEMVYLRYLFLAISVGFVFSMVMIIISALGGVLQRIFVR